MFGIKKEKVYELLKRLNDQKSDIWSFGNDVLYNMCKEQPLHNKKNIVASKVWLIGRSYAAAIERTKSGESLETIIDKFWDNLNPESENIDNTLRVISSIPIEKVENNIKTILDAHKRFMDIIQKATTMDKRSLTSKYLHFHCPNAFFIYDSRARRAINKLVKKQDISGYTGDAEYVEFFLRVLKLQQFIKEQTGKIFTPREIDNFLVFNN